MAATLLHTSLLRPPVLHILRAAGFTATRPAVLDTLVDLTSRYLTLLATTIAHHTHLHPASLPPDIITISDIRLALQDVGALYPQMSVMEEQLRGEEDLRGIDAFIAWCTGPENREIRRIAGLVPPAEEGAGAAQSLIEESAALEAHREDFLSQLKKKHSKTATGEESRYAGTVLGREGGVREIVIEGGEVESLAAWGEKLRRIVGEEVGSSESSSPLSEISGLESGV